MFTNLYLIISWKLSANFVDRGIPREVPILNIPRVVPILYISPEKCQFLISPDKRQFLTRPDPDQNLRGGVKFPGGALFQHIKL